jgi:hypothetical protein
MSMLQNVAILRRIESAVVLDGICMLPVALCRKGVV